MLGRHPCPSPPSRPTGEGDANLCVSRPENCDETPKLRGARPGAGRPKRPRKPPGRPPHAPTGELRRFVGALVTILNLNHEQVAEVMGLTPEDAAQALSQRLAEGGPKRDIAVVQTFVAKCLGGNRDRGRPARLAQGRHEGAHLVHEDAARLAREERHRVGRPAPRSSSGGSSKTFDGPARRSPKAGRRSSRRLPDALGGRRVSSRQ